MTYEITDGYTSETITADSLEDALQEAKEWVEAGDYSGAEKTIWVDVRVTQVGDADECDSATVQIDPTEPPCTSRDGHDWQSPHGIVGGITDNPGIWGHGGGVTIAECCMRCGARRDTDTWATRDDTGESGMTSVSYEEPGHYELIA